MSKAAQRLHARLRDAALGYPGAVEEFPWGESVIKVHKKVFVFLGHGPDDPGCSLKLPESCHYALTLACCEPTGYGLSRAGWVTVHFARPDCPKFDLLADWLDESYRVVAPKRLVAQLDQS